MTTARPRGQCKVDLQLVPVSLVSEATGSSMTYPSFLVRPWHVLEILEQWHVSESMDPRRYLLLTPALSQFATPILELASNLLQRSTSTA